MQSTVDESDVLVYAKDRDGRYVLVNTGFAVRAGRSAGEILGRRTDDIFEPEVASGLVALEAKLADGAAPVVAHLRFPRGEDEFRAVRVERDPAVDDASYWVLTPIGRGARGEDVAYREGALDALLDAEHDARDRAETALRQKDRFLSALSHELRTPLNAMVGWLHLLQSAANDPDLRARAERGLARAIDRQRRITDDLIETARLTSGRAVVERRELDLGAAVGAVLARFAAAAAEAGVTLAADLPPPGSPPPTALGDPARLEQALGRIVENSLKFTRRGGRVTLSLVFEPNRAGVAVVDDGSGIEAGLLARLQGREDHRDSAESRRGGLGLGLTIAQQVVNLQGGELVITSPGLGRGTSASVILARPLGSLPEGDQGGESRSLRGISVLAVDDQSEMREVLAMLLKRWGARVIVVGSAREARKRYIRWARRVGRGLLISDIAMPGEDGLALITSLRRCEREHGLRRIPAVALSAHSSASDRAAALGAGFDLFVEKPLDPEDLRRVLKRLAVP